MKVKGNKRCNENSDSCLYLTNLLDVSCFRYKSLCPDTWPTWNGRLVDGVSTLVKHIGYKPEEYKLGRLVTQMF